MENTNNTKKIGFMGKLKAKYDKAMEEHPVATKIGTGVVIVGTAAGVFFIGRAIYKACKPAADIVPLTENGIDPDPLTNLPDCLGFDQMKLVNKEGEILADSIIDIGCDYVVADDYNIKNMVKALGDLEAVIEAANQVADEAAAVVEVAVDI